MLNCYESTGKSLSEALIFASTNPEYDDRLFIELQVQYMKIPSSNLWRTCWLQKLFLTFRTIFVHKMFSPCSTKRRAYDKDLPVQPLFSLHMHKIPLSILVLCIKQLDINWWFTSNQNLYIDLVKKLTKNTCDNYAAILTLNCQAQFFSIHGLWHCNPMNLVKIFLFMMAGN